MKLVEGEDYYVEGGLYIFTREYLLKRGYCCDNNCRHCPYRKRDRDQRARQTDVTESKCEDRGVLGRS